MWLKSVQWELRFQVSWCVHGPVDVDVDVDGPEATLLRQGSLAQLELVKRLLGTAGACQYVCFIQLLTIK